MSARERILGRVRAAVAQRPTTEHPGGFTGARPPGTGAGSAIERFRAVFEASGGEIVVVTSEDAAVQWLASFLSDIETASCGATLGTPWRTRIAGWVESAEPDTAEVGISRGRGAVAETGSLILGARDGRRTQLLAPTHVVLVDPSRFHDSLRDALVDLGGDLPSAVGFHSGPSKSADIGQILVRGVHGPGRVIALVFPPDAGASS